MKKTIFLTSLLLSLGFYAQASDINNQSIDVKEESNVGHTHQETLSEEYYKNQQEAPSQCESKKSGTYTEYHSNGMLKSFRIVD